MKTLLFLKQARRSISVAALAFLAATGSFAPREAKAITPSSEEAALANLLVGASGQARPYLKYDPILNQVARERAQDMARRGYVSHVNPDGNGPNELVKRAGYPLPEWWGSDPSSNQIESLAAGRSSASETWSDFMGSAGHKRHLLAELEFYRDQTSYGVGYAADSSSEYRYYWVVLTAPARPVASVSISTPAAKARLDSSDLVVSGTVSTLPQVRSVQVRLENASGITPYTDAVGTSTWSAEIRGILPGENTLRVRSLDAKGNVVAQAARSFDRVVTTPLVVNLVGPGEVTSAFTGTSQREVGVSYTISAKASPDSLFTGWTGTHTTAEPKLKFVMASDTVLTANFIRNPFLDRRGSYRLAMVDPAQGSSSLSGILAVNVTSNGSFSGRLDLRGAKYPIRGSLNFDGAATVAIPIPGGGAINVLLQLDAQTKTGLTATVTDGTHELTAQTGLSFDAKRGSFNRAGRYTVALVSNADQGDLPQGNGYATLVVTERGRAILAGATADGTAFSCGIDVAADGNMPVFAALYRDTGAVAGNLRFAESPEGDVEGALHWFKPASPSSKYHASGFAGTLTLVGSSYVQPQQGIPVVQILPGENNLAFSFGLGNLDAPVTDMATLDASNRVRISGAYLSGLSAKLSATTGYFRGKFRHPVSGEIRKFQGVILQKQNAGFGYFLGTNESGYASFTSVQ